ncbi:MAG: hypothetical protein ACREHC_02480 [Candidatus Levyibacteriota bacterium]
MDPITLRSYIDNARYQLEQAVQRRASYEDEAAKYDKIADDLEYQAQQNRKYAQDARDNANSYSNDEYTAQRDLEYYSNQLSEVNRLAAQALL